MNNKKRNNKGFSLVELIVVIAIMAVLVGVLAPAFLGYVEKSRKSTDINSIDNIMQTMNAVAAEGKVSSMTATCAADTVDFEATATSGEAADKTAIEDELDNILGTVKMKSKDFKGWKLTGTVNTETGKVDFTLDNEGSDAKGADNLLDYSDDLANKVTKTTNGGGSGNTNTDPTQEPTGE